MKKPSVFLIFFVSLAICACENPMMAKILQQKTITFESNGGSPVPSQSLIKNKKITEPNAPTKTGFFFDGWYLDNFSFMYKWDFNDIPKEDMTLYAAWNYKESNAAATYTNDTINKAPAGTYTVTFDVASDDNWYNAEGLSAGTLTLDSVFTSGNALKAYLDTLAPNNVGSPITVELKISDEQEFPGIKSVLDDNYSKYVILDLSKSTISTIPANAFYTISGNNGSPCYTLTGIILPSGVTDIGNDAFRGCINLASVTMPSGVITIGNDSFRNTNLTDVIIPDSVASIGQEAFVFCNNLTSVTFEGTILYSDFSESAFNAGNLRSVFYEENELYGTPGTYIREEGGEYWWW